MQSQRNKKLTSWLSMVKLISQEAIVIRINKSRFVNLSSMAVGLLVTVLLVTGGASAKERKAKASDNQVYVVAHIPFEGLSDVDMAMQKKVSDKYYLYVQHSKDQGISIIDISKPAEPKIVGTTPWPDSALSSRMNVTGDLAIIAENDVPRRSSSNDGLVLWDLSNPAVPRVVQKFEGVVKWLEDGRDFVYVLNAEGLWIVSKPDNPPKQNKSSDSYGG
jgi:LVIVD repeat-containing protein